MYVHVWQSLVLSCDFCETNFEHTITYILKYISIGNKRRSLCLALRLCEDHIAKLHKVQSVSQDCEKISTW